MASRTDDRRIRRTKQHLKDALLSLIRERGFEALTVQDIIDRADVGRSTFYTHFRGKEDLLVMGIEDLSEALGELQRRAAGATGDAGRFAFFGELLRHVEEHRDVFRAMVGKRSGAVVQRRFQTMLAQLIGEELAVMAGARREPTLPLEALVHYLTSGLWGLLAWWVSKKRSIGPDDLAAQFGRLAHATIQAVTAGSPLPGRARP